MKKVLFVLLILSVVLLLAFGCSVKENEVTPIENTGEIGSFSAITPLNDVVLNEIPVFSWTEAENADSYTLEIASDRFFDITDELYISKTGITDTTFTIVSELKKNQEYFWRVTAKNAKNSTVITGEFLSFYYEATLYDEIPVSIGYADEWKVHEVGSKATVSLDHNDFFNNGKEALRVSFDSEDTQRGPKYVESNGWVVVTRSLETEFYGVDAFYFNFYYAGNDASAYFRLIDDDNEYWYAPIKLAVNAKQTIIIRLEDFTLRTKGTPVMNEKFDYNYLKSVELVFERVDGDGVAYFGDLRAIKYDNYKDRFIDSIDFNQFKDNVTKESEYFNFETVIDQESDGMSISFTTNNAIDDAKKGYGFVNLGLNKILAGGGDAFALKVNLSSGIATSDCNFLVRVVEEDNDIWVFKIPVKEIPVDEELLIPFSAFVLADGGFKGDGIKQFYYLKQIQFGLNSCYQSGQIVIQEVSLKKLSEKLEDLYLTEVDENGVIEDFESYERGVDVYYKWATSTANKDESVELYVDSALGSKNHAAKLGYKTDLPEAEYRINFTPVENYTAIEVCAKNLSDSIKPTMTIYLFGAVDEIYSYEIKKLNKDWYSYVVPISEFTLIENAFGSQHITCDRITGIALAFSYSNLTPKYDSGNFVCVDNIRFTQGTEFTKTEASQKIKLSGNKAMISDFESDETFVYWDVKEGVFASSDMAANAAASINAEESASGTGRSLQLSYKTQQVAPYSADIVVDSRVEAKGVTLLMKGDGKTPYVEVILYVNDKGYKAKIDIADGWNYYTIGFSNFKYNDSEKLLSSKVTSISEVALYIKNYNGNFIPSDLYLDEIFFDNELTINTNTNTVRAYE